MSNKVYQFKSTGFELVIGLLTWKHASLHIFGLSAEPFLAGLVRDRDSFHNRRVDTAAVMCYNGIADVPSL